MFQDETWIFQHGSNTRYNWNDGTKDGAGGQLKACTGKRFIICHAGSEFGFVPNASMAFPSKVAHMDYHGDMNGQYFMKWAEEQLLPNLPTKSAVIIDNASYHGLRVSLILHHILNILFQFIL